MREEMIMHCYSVPKMSCGHCAGTIDQAVESVDPVAEVTFDLKAKQIAIRSAAEDAQIVNAVRAAGYEIAPIAG